MPMLPLRPPAPQDAVSAQGVWRASCLQPLPPPTNPPRCLRFPPLFPPCPAAMPSAATARCRATAGGTPSTPSPRRPSTPCGSGVRRYRSLSTWQDPHAAAGWLGIGVPAHLRASSVARGGHHSGPALVALVPKLLPPVLPCLACPAAACWWPSCWACPCCPATWSSLQ